MTVASPLRFERFVPQHLMDRYLSGELGLYGSTLRRAAGTGGGGQIAGFLVEGQRLAQQVQDGAAPTVQQLTAAVGNAQMAAQLASGIGVLNLGVNVVGFAVIARRLDRLADSIKRLDAEMRAQGEVLDWLQADALLALDADARTALSLADRAARQNNPQLFNDARTRAEAARRRLAGHLSAMEAKNTTLRQHRLYHEFLAMAALLAHAEARCDEAVEGAGQAAAGLRAPAAELRAAADAFVARLDFHRSARDLLHLGPDARGEVKNTARAMEAVADRLASYAAELELRQVLDLDAAAYRALLPFAGPDRIVCVTVEGGQDVLGAARAWAAARWLFSCSPE